MEYMRKVSTSLYQEALRNAHAALPNIAHDEGARAAEISALVGGQRAVENERNLHQALR
jgi:hypothetical protein